ncbi:hypothetical protein ABZ599_39440 [Streptomyces misionensis]|uniref:hypothetical protein n=1 Tax=Streptomyces misionensis TaxID=67331 RepID=UPI0033CC44CC
MTLTGEPGGVEPLAEEAVVAACTLADAAEINVLFAMLRNGTFYQPRTHHRA